MTQFYVRSAEFGDARGIATVRVRGWQAGYAGLIPTPYLDSMDVASNCVRVQKWLRNASVQQSHWVCLEGSEIIGWALTFDHARDHDLPSQTSELVACYVLPAVWGRGAGFSLCAHALRALKQRGKKSVVLWVLADNERAIRFYRRQGFDLDGQSKSEQLTEHIDVQEVRMHLEL